MSNPLPPKPDWSPELSRILDQYPRIKPSPSFNQRVLQALEGKKVTSNKLLQFCDLIDRLFERPLPKLIGTTTLAIVLALTFSHIISGFEPKEQKIAANQNKAYSREVLAAGNFPYYQLMNEEKFLTDEFYHYKNHFNKE